MCTFVNKEKYVQGASCATPTIVTYQIKLQIWPMVKIEKKKLNTLDELAQRFG